MQVSSYRYQVSPLTPDMALCTMVFLGSLLYIATFVLIDLAYTWADPRVRLG